MKKLRLQSSLEASIFLLQRLSNTIPGSPRLARLGRLLGCGMVTTLDVVCVFDIAIRVSLDAQFQELAKGFCKVIEEEILVLGVLLDPRAKRLILDKREVGWQHGQFLIEVLIDIDELLDAILQCLLLPVIIGHDLEVRVAEACRVGNPRAVEARSVHVHAPKVVCSAECDYLLIGKAHTVEDEANVVGTLCSVWKTTSGRKFAVVDIVCSASEPLDLGTSHLFQGHDSGQCPQVGI